MLLKESFCLKKEKRRKPKQPSPWETVGAIVATHPPAPCPPSGQSRTCLLRRSYGGDEDTVSDAFDAVTEEMVLGDEIEQHGGLILYTGVEVHTAKGLIDLPNGALEGVVFLVSEERGVTKLLFQHIDFLHGILVGGVKGLLAGGLADAQPLIVVVVEGVEWLLFELSQILRQLGSHHPILLSKRC